MTQIFCYISDFVIPSVGDCFMNANERRPILNNIFCSAINYFSESRVLYRLLWLTNSLIINKWDRGISLKGVCWVNKNQQMRMSKTCLKACKNLKI